MSDFARCPNCRSYDFLSRHRCPPVWEARPEWDCDDYWTEVHAVDAESAAEKFAEIYDRDGGEYSIVSGRFRDCIIQVRKPGEDQIDRYSIDAEAVPTYYGRKLDEAVTSPERGGDNG